jgi:hypothetical protein
MRRSDSHRYAEFLPDAEAWSSGATRRLQAS